MAYLAHPREFQSALPYKYAAPAAATPPAVLSSSILRAEAPGRPAFPSRTAIP